MRRILLAAVLGTASLFGADASAVCAGNVLCAGQSTCYGAVNVCPGTENCYGWVNVCDVWFPAG